MKNYRQQMSPLIAESFGLSKDNQEILKSGDEKYQGFVVTYFIILRIHVFINRTNKYILQLELEVSIPECQLYLVGLRRGILGHPKCLYDTMLNLNENLLRKMELSDDCDPFGILKQASIEIHTLNGLDVERFEERDSVVLSE